MKVSNQIEISKELENNFEEFISNPAYPCAGARTALIKQKITYCTVGDLANVGEEEIRRVLKAIHQFIVLYQNDRDLFRSFVLIFKSPVDLDEVQFEKKFWSFLECLNMEDSRTSKWDPRVSSNPADKSFSFSVGGEAFYLVGMHPGASRPARKFSHPAIVFNLKVQFDALRSSGKYNRLRDVIRSRDIAYSGSVNPMMQDFGIQSEARQYSGRVTDSEWKCPFRKVSNEQTGSYH